MSDNRGDLTHKYMEAVMGFLDKIKDKATDAATKHSDKISGGLNKAGDMLDKRTKGKYTDKIVTGKAKVGEGLSKLDNSRDITSTNPTGQPTDSPGTSPTSSQGSVMDDATPITTEATSSVPPRQQSPQL
ncbi:MAG: antitoxin [Nocardioidaceae bacterium]